MENTTTPMRAQVHAPPPEANSTPFQGYGLFTDVEVEVPSNDPSLSRKHYLIPQFLPLDEPGHVPNKRHKKEELPDGVRRVYDELEAVLLQEEEAHRRGTRKDPEERFQRLEYPSIMVPPPPPSPPPLPKYVKLLIETAKILEMSVRSRDEAMEETMEHIMDETMYDVREDIPEETMYDFQEDIREEIMGDPREEPRDNTGGEAREDTVPDTTHQPTEAVEQGIVKSEENQHVAVQNTEPTEGDWGDDSDVKIIESRPLVYKAPKFCCLKCRTRHGDLTLLMNHMLRNHLKELASTYWQCCTDQVWNASLTSYVRHWGGVHGFRNFPCPKCALGFKSMPEVRKHWIEEHNNPVGKAKNARSTTPKVSNVPKPQSSMAQIRNGSNDSTPPTSVASMPQNHVDQESKSSVNTKPQTSIDPGSQHVIEGQPQSLAILNSQSTIEPRPQILLPPRPQIPLPPKPPVPVAAEGASSGESDIAYSDDSEPMSPVDPTQQAHSQGPVAPMKKSSGVPRPASPVAAKQTPVVITHKSPVATRQPNLPPRPPKTPVDDGEKPSAPRSGVPPPFAGNRVPSVTPPPPSREPGPPPSPPPPARDTTPPGLPPTEQLHCRNCRLDLKDLKDFVGHMIERHTGELNTVYFACCLQPDRRYYKATSSSFSHVQDVHGWDELCPLPCHVCGVYFSDLQDVIDHVGKWHQVSQTPRSAILALGSTSFSASKTRTPPRLRTPSTEGADSHPAFRSPTPRRERSRPQSRSDVRREFSPAARSRLYAWGRRSPSDDQSSVSRSRSPTRRRRSVSNDRSHARRFSSALTRSRSPTRRRRNRSLSSDRASPRRGRSRSRRVSGSTSRSRSPTRRRRRRRRRSGSTSSDRASSKREGHRYRSSARRAGSSASRSRSPRRRRGGSSDDRASSRGRSRSRIRRRYRSYTSSASRSRSPPRRRRRRSTSSHERTSLRRETSRYRPRAQRNYSSAAISSRLRSRSPSRRRGRTHRTPSSLSSSSTHDRTWHPAFQQRPASRSPSPYRHPPQPTSSTTAPIGPTTHTAPAPSLTLNIYCFTCTTKYTSIPALTSHLVEHHLDELPKLRWTCCSTQPTRGLATLRHLETVHGWADALPCPEETCTASFELLPEWHQHVKEHARERKVAAMMRGDATARGDDGVVRRAIVASGSAMDLSNG
ncbi:hypothetical protein P171DRAFT_45447 [Karstenula rhodostoma CBS 690.94]|uniref:C2H2-type domain-containing protein n=1 Tax=Karstenula rhodostoma CBS 690.94 TaxID=1392251 RepID=A0A9P4UC12_9PLEO|nr:hypothetical protein P171DRAFT_45447 [Karstenula rhodostoma CBS 690.94]